MDVTTTTPVAANSVPELNAPHTAEPDGDDVLSSDFDTYLLMLTEQLKNQDPLNPSESTELSVQLATFSQVEQQAKTNDLLESLTESMTLGDLGQIASWVGMEGRAEVSAQFDGAPVEVFPEIPNGTDQATLVVRDENAKEVSRMAIDADAQSFTWDGTDVTGAPVPAGEYSFYTEARSGGELLSIDQASVYAPITEVRSEDDTSQVVFADGSARAVAQISGIREAPVR